MAETSKTMGGQPITLVGNKLTEGQESPEFVLTDVNLNQVKLSDFEGKVVLLSCVPSIDTPTCSLETRRLNQEAAALEGNLAVITVSKDLPFAQARWSKENNIDKIIFLSDFRSPSFATTYGVLIKEVGLLTRALFVINKEGVIDYIQFVEEVSHEPKYEEVIAAAKKLL